MNDHQLSALLAFHTHGRAASLATQVRLTGTTAPETPLRVRWAWGVARVDRTIAAAMHQAGVA